jgi:hypothetical protein
VKKRYGIAGPVKGGSSWWYVTDLRKNLTLVSISANVPNAEELARNILKQLNDTEAVK